MRFDDLAQPQPPFEARLDEPLLAYWHARLTRHFADSYAGVLLLKFPEDLRVYEHLLFETLPDAVVEIGTQSGGSALWFRDRLAALERYGGPRRARVISVDVTHEDAVPALDAADPEWRQTITLVEGDVRDPELPRRVRALLPDGARCFVVEDSAHTRDTTAAALRGFADFVAPGGWFVVEDGCVDIEALRPRDDWPRGVLAAIDAFLASPEGEGWERRRAAEAYGISCHPGGFLQRVR